jgi:hypothetical protein
VEGALNDSSFDISLAQPAIAMSTAITQRKHAVLQSKQSDRPAVDHDRVRDIQLERLELADLMKAHSTHSPWLTLGRLCVPQIATN